MMKKQCKRGVLLYAFNNEQMDYLSLGLECAKRVKKHWGLPVSIVTDSSFSSDVADCINVNAPEFFADRFYSGYGNLKFLNAKRSDSFDLTPYDQTIVIDSDLLVSTTQIVDVWNGKAVQLPNEALMLDGSPLYDNMLELCPDGLKMYWATVLCFDKSKESQVFFNYWKKVQKWYKSYAAVYGFKAGMFRNDFCVTVALDLLSNKIGSLAPFTLPYSIPTSGFESKIVNMDPITLDVEGDLMTFPNTDVHVLNKKPLLEIITAGESTCLTSSVSEA